ncbi:ABC transporter ATP-binding protein [Paenibacillus validus]|uniref:ATP-binding cassette domain-containing protein n=1 Tax=Paenibacillus validus TaxID=44253 RepID=A0A7X2Z9T1_9BACL|nr:MULTISPECIES: ABC transporter ATP-binding protein [Paenibacillus]MED4603770.1 ABC transporter ATP-binding protein [Paenibacillus validus]MED4608102.1 ABC transporter ATP-binding protein [Paenibacillus validus]MUG70370.1 ATP-binding cassette domain-containing protein [Paenibacillus validus]
MADTVLHLQGVKKDIGGQPIIHSLDMQVDRGQVLALCGGNGAGKSTILRMIVGILQPTHGTIEVNGLSWKESRKAYAEQIGYMPDDYLFGQGLSAEETLAFWASLRKVSPSRVHETLTLVGLADVKNKPVTSFSKGMRQRLLFAQALLAKPPLLVMDEPTNGLDPYWMDSFVDLVRYAKQEGHAVIFSTHQLQVAEAAADHVVFLKEGRIVEEGTTASFIQAYGSYGLQAVFAKLFGFR